MQGLPQLPVLRSSHHRLPIGPALIAHEAEDGHKLGLGV
jgi:hypothetical protein